MEVYIKEIDDLESNLKELLHLLAWEELIAPGERVLIKPNLCTHELKDGVTTSKDLLACLVRILRERTSNVFIGETESFGKDFEKLEKNFDLDCGLVNLSRVESRIVDSPFGALPLPQIALESRIINVPVLKTHGLTSLTLGIKNLFGLLQTRQKSRYHGAIDELLVYLLEMFKPAINILDASYSMDGDGPTSGKVKRTDFLMASRNVISLDAAACEAAGINPKSIKHIRMAMERFKTQYRISSGFRPDLRLQVPHRGNIDRLGELLLRNSLGRKLLMNPAIYSSAKSIKKLMKKL